VRLDDSELIIPIIGRFQGAFDTLWRTDVFLRSSYWEPVSGTMTFYVANGAPVERPFQLGARESMTYRDIVKNEFGLDIASGQLHLITDSGIHIEARARVFNAGNPAGEFGQGIEGIGMGWLQDQAVLFGLDGTHGSRVNVGIANPTSTSVTVTMRVLDRDFRELYRDTLVLQPHETRQFNDIFTAFGIPAQENIEVECLAPHPSGERGASIYVYSSEVRNDTGDAIFVFATGPNAAMYGPPGKR
jgi:hypothetical protein